MICSLFIPYSTRVSPWPVGCSQRSTTASKVCLMRLCCCRQTIMPSSRWLFLFYGSCCSVITISTRAKADDTPKITVACFSNEDKSSVNCHQCKEQCLFLPLLCHPVVAAAAPRSTFVARYSIPHWSFPVMGTTTWRKTTLPKPPLPPPRFLGSFDNRRDGSRKHVPTHQCQSHRFRRPCVLLSPTASLSDDNSSLAAPSGQALAIGPV